MRRRLIRIIVPAAALVLMFAGSAQAWVPATMQQHKDQAAWNAAIRCALIAQQGAPCVEAGLAPDRTSQWLTQPTTASHAIRYRNSYGGNVLTCRMGLSTTLATGSTTWRVFPYYRDSFYPDTPSCSGLG